MTDYLNSLAANNSNSTRPKASNNPNDNLIADYVKNELMTWKSNLLYLQNLINYHDDDTWYVNRVASDCCSLLNYDYQFEQRDAEYIKGIIEVQNKVISKAKNLMPDFSIRPEKAIIRIATSNKLEILIQYIEQLVTCISKIEKQVSRDVNTVNP